MELLKLPSLETQKLNEYQNYFKKKLSLKMMNFKK